MKVLNLKDFFVNNCKHFLNFNFKTLKKQNSIENIKKIHS